MEVDYQLPPGPPGRAPAAARRAEALGFDGFLTSETSHDPFLPLALAAPAAPRLRIGTAIAVAFPRSPMVTAQLAWDLAALSGGRFALGLGTQVRAHVTRRFSTSWSPPVPRLREYVESLRTIWSAFQEGGGLRYRGAHYSFTLLTPFFRPAPIDHPDIPVSIAGVGPGLSRLAGELCDGFHVHPFHTPRSLEGVVLAGIREGARSAGRRHQDVTVTASVFVVSGRDEAEMERARRAARQQIAFYASTPSYRSVLEVQGWGFGERLTRMSRRGAWEEMADVVDDEVLEAVAVVGPPDAIGPATRARYGGAVQRVSYASPLGDGLLEDDDWEAVVRSTKGPGSTRA